MGRARLRAGGTRPTRSRCRACDACMNYIGDRAGAEVPAADRPGARGRGGADLQGAVRRCHEPGGTRTGTVIPLEEIGTDRHRLDMWTPACGHRVQRLRRRPRLEVLELPQDQRLHGRAARRHLAHGTVPAQRIGADACRTCSSRPRQRPTQFWRGYDVFDAAARRFRDDGGRRPSASARRSTSRAPATATPATPTARR